MKLDDILDILGDLEDLGVSETPLGKRLKIFREIQERCKNSCHLGGSIGLFLHGIDLGRNFLNSDLDITFYKPKGDIFPTSKAGKGKIAQVEAFKSAVDMDEFCYFGEIADQYGDLVKGEFKYDTSQSFDLIEYEGFTYQVTKSDIILGWKVLFASRGSKKHRDDLDRLGIGYVKRAQCPLLSPVFRKYQTWSSLEADLKKRNLNGKNLQVLSP